MTSLKDKRIVLAATGSVAVYKAVDLASKLTQAGALVDVVMTEAAQQFVTPLTFQSVTGRPVYTDLWRGESSGALPTHIAHVGLAEGADLIAVVPATANTLARLAHGFADDLLTVTALAARCPLLLAPAMDGGMYEHAATQANVKTLVERGAHLVAPEVGRFASGLSGRGRLPDTPTLIGHIRQVLGNDGPLKGRGVIVTAGGTREPLDPVRFLTNRSSGKQGHAIAQAAVDAGADVMLITTAGQPVPVGAQVVHVGTAVEMRDAVVNDIRAADALIMAAAISDFRPALYVEQKIKKQGDDEGMVLELARNPDILVHLKTILPEESGKVIVGFAAESENLLSNAQKKLKSKGLDFLVANDITVPDAGFQADTNRVVIIDRDGTETPLDLMSKAEVAREIIARVAALLATKGEQQG